MSQGNLLRLYEQSDGMDQDDGRRAYIRYHDLMRDFAEHYDFSFEGTVGAFCALSPNNDYVGNLRSLVSLMAARKWNMLVDDIRPAMEAATVSTYKHCQRRAIGYLIGEQRFLDHAKGPKIRAFYQNIVDPTNWEPVTVDGHMVCAWLDADLTMTQAAGFLGAREYREIAAAIRSCAQRVCMIPHQFQATLWFARKRIKGVKYDPQLDMLSLGGAQRTTFAVNEIKPYAHREIIIGEEIPPQVAVQLDLI